LCRPPGDRELDDATESSWSRPAALIPERASSGSRRSSTVPPEHAVDNRAAGRSGVTSLTRSDPTDVAVTDAPSRAAGRSDYAATTTTSAR
jgi:hypothetical protein